MNFLAHFHVTPPIPDAIVGAYLGDFVRGPVHDHVDLPLQMRQGIILHRQVDGYTDAHPVWQRSAGRLNAKRRRLAGIIIDVIYDHFLCRHWEDLASQPLDEFVEFCYSSLISRTQLMEQDARRAVRRMREHDWLASYQQVEGIELAFRRLSYRSRALKGIEEAAVDFKTDYEALETDFLEYYPELQGFSREAWGENHSRGGQPIVRHELNFG